MKRRVRKCYSGIGGQAVLEGVMMKNNQKYAVAVRTPDGNISVEVDEYPGILHGNWVTKVPFLRGIFNFFDSMVLGIKALNYSADFYDDEEHKETGVDKAADKVTGGKGEELMVAGTIVLAVILALGLFLVLPYVISSLIVRHFDVVNTSLLAIIEGVIRIVIFILYIVVISLLKDIHRLYMYHGAEHKCINCLERGDELTVANVKKASRLHRRCGTSFLLLVVLISVIVYIFIPPFDQVWLRVLVRILLIPAVAGISYEVLRLAGRYDNFITKAISAPGMLMQLLTTKEPTDDMIEVGIESVNAIFDWHAFLDSKFRKGEAGDQPQEDLSEEETKDRVPEQSAETAPETAEGPQQNAEE